MKARSSSASSGRPWLGLSKALFPADRFFGWVSSCCHVPTLSQLEIAGAHFHVPVRQRAYHLLLPFLQVFTDGILQFTRRAIMKLFLFEVVFDIFETFLDHFDNCFFLFLVHKAVVAHAYQEEAELRARCVEEAQSNSGCAHTLGWEGKGDAW